MSEIVLELQKVCKDFEGPLGNKVHLLEDVAFGVELNKTTSLLAPGGAGKSTLLKLIAGLDFATTGEIELKREGKVVFIPSAPSSFPWLSTIENIKFAAPDLSQNKQYELIELLGLEGYEDHFPDNGSFGYRLRVSLGRSLAVNPSIILLDEPFKNMDSRTKQEIYDLLHHINQSIDVTFLIGTTNVSEALYLSEQLILMGSNPGRILQKFDVEFIAERNSDLFGSEEFLKKRNEIESIFRQNHSQLYNLSI